MRAASEAGVTLVELLLALALTTMVLASAIALLEDAGVVSEVLPEAADMQGRARAAADGLWRDVVAAGAGIDGGVWAGPLVQHFAPVLPRRVGLSGADAATVARADAVSLIGVPRTAAQTTLATPFGSGDTTLVVVPAANCPATPQCGFVAGSMLMVFDGIGAFDLFDVTSVTPAASRVVHLAASPGSSFAAGSAVAQAEIRVYYFDAVDAQLRLYDGYGSDVPIIDNVVAATFEYFGDPAPPVMPKPPPGVDNCLFDTSGAPRPLSAVAASAPIFPLPLSVFNDGPWCGHGDTAFDADLLRIRRVRITIRVQASAASLRGAGPGFLRPGSSRDAKRQQPDYVLTFDVSPRNLGGWR